VKIQLKRSGSTALDLGVALFLLLSGCGKSETESGSIAVSTPKEAASQLERAFEKADPEIKKSADIASEAIRNGDYEKAVVSLQVIRSGESISLDQGMAIHSSIVTLESKLISAMEAGDPNAKRAYELLKGLKRH
jgi:hypothetical protein